MDFKDFLIESSQIRDIKNKIDKLRAEESPGVRTVLGLQAKWEKARRDNETVKAERIYKQIMSENLEE